MSNQQQQNCRWGEVILLDGRSVEILIQVFLVNNLITDLLLDISIFFLILKNKPRLFAGDLFDTVATHFDLKEKEFFGLAFLDETYVFGFVFFFILNPIHNLIIFPLILFELKSSSYRYR